MPNKDENIREAEEINENFLISLLDSIDLEPVAKNLINGIIRIASYFVIVLVSVIFDLIYAFPLMWTWNYTMPKIFKLPVISYWEAFSLLILAGLLWKISTVAIPQIDNFDL